MEERRLILAFALSFAVLLGFRMWTSSRYPPSAEQATQVQTTGSPKPGASVSSSPSAPASAVSTPTVVAATSAPLAPLISGVELRTEITTKESEVAFSTRGARLISWKLLGYLDHRGKPMEIHPGGDPKPGPLDLITGRSDIDTKLREALFRSTDASIAGEQGATFEFSDGVLEATKTIRTIKGGRAFRVDAMVKEGGVVVPVRVFWGPGLGQATDEEKSLRGYLPPQVVEIDEAGKELRLTPAGLSEERSVRAKVLGIENKYFAAIMTSEDGASIDARVGVSKDEKSPGVELQVVPPLALTVGAKDYDRLKSIGLGAEKVVPVGSWIGPIVVPLTRALRYVNVRVGNFGIAIILLTIAISLAMAPLRLYAIVSSAKMAKVAPQIRAVQERYKRLSLTDPKRQQMQAEIAEVYEKNGIDMIKQTATGCLPTLLTMPFFFAFYRMLDISVDLKGAPFFWIPDLSLKDPLFITPVLSGLSMIAAQRLMPAPAMDPAQQRMMLLMPIIFSGMFAWAPAGLNLYWFVSNLSAMSLQLGAMYFAPHLFPKAKPTT
ncbi:MAG: membrane protein insertase YidC [Vicinamibacteria bacterium]